MGALARFVSWLLQKLTLSVALLIVGVAGFALWIFLREHVDLDLRRQELVRVLNGQNRQIRSALDGVELRIAEMQASLVRHEQRAREAARIATDIAAMNSGLNRLGTSNEQLRRNEERIVSLRELEAEARREAATVRESLTRAEWERDGLKIALGRLDARLREAEAQKSRVVEYAREAWARYGLYLVTIVLLWLIAPPLGRLAAYFVVAPFVSARRPVRLGGPTPLLPEVMTSRAALEVTLAPGEALWVKEIFLQASDEGLEKRTRWLFDWRMPLTCLAAGLKELVEMRNTSEDERRTATFSSQESAHVEVAQLTLPEGASVVLRPRYVAGVLGRMDRKRGIVRRHWRLFTLQAWATGQFRYFEFVGPCQLLIAGSRGVRAESLRWSPGQALPGRRVNQEATIGFTPGLAYRPVRAETFWAYFRGQNPLFDDLFEGEGVFLCQQTTARAAEGKGPGAWERFRDGVLRIFGL